MAFFAPVPPQKSLSPTGLFHSSLPTIPRLSPSHTAPGDHKIEDDEAALLPRANSSVIGTTHSQRSVGSSEHYKPVDPPRTRLRRAASNISERSQKPFFREAIGGRPRERTNPTDQRSIQSLQRAPSSIARHRKQPTNTTTPPAPVLPPLRGLSDALISPGSDLSRKLARSDSLSRSPSTLETRPPSKQATGDRKMHQTSSRLLRMRDDDLPFTRDFKDLFSTLMVSLPLTPHRVRFSKVDHTFTSEEAITNLGSLKFSQSNRMPDPKDPSRIVTTTTTTTFSMAKEMARSVCQKFLDARFIESVDGKNDFSSKTAVWQLTPKGMHILQRFCQRNGINQRHVFDVLESPRNTMMLVILERENDTDKLHRDQGTIEVVFRRFAGVDGPNIKNDTSASDSDSLSDYATGMVGVKMAKERKVNGRTYKETFTGKACVDWIMDCCTVVDRREVVELAGMFCEFGLIQTINAFPPQPKFVPTKSAIYEITPKGRRVAGWDVSPKSSLNGDSVSGRRDGATSRDSNANRMTVIIRDPALRLLFREFLRDTHCEENLSFYLDVKEFLDVYRAAKGSGSIPKLDVVRETLAAAYSLYNAFLAPGSPCELNIDHTLRTALAARMTRAVGEDDAMIKSLDEVAALFDQAQTSVFKLMASDSVPKFMREPRYSHIIRDRNLETALSGTARLPATPA